MAKTLGRQLEPDIHEKQREFLRVEFENFREKAKLLSYEISTVLPDYTVHSIEHIDALWDTAELIVSKEYNINPAEAFVLGGAFLLHDLGMALAAYPKGIDELKAEQIWQDTDSAFRREKSNNPEYINNAQKLEIESKKYATDKTLRLLHAKRADKLAAMSWKDSKGNDVFLMDNIELRNSYSHIIGLVAYSHWWNIEELSDKLPHPLGALSRFPSDWIVDSLKLACILRVADAMQIDDRRAPSFLRILRQPPKFANLHWIFQEKLYQPRLEQNRIVYTSKSPFDTNETESWWICFDTLKMIDNELRQVDALLASKNKQTLAAYSVSSVEDPRRLSKLITVDGWQPIDVQIKVNNVAKLVSTIGGSQLYGKNMLVPLRELIQNASDAIRARRVIEDETPDYGDIFVRIGEDEDRRYIAVEDNGIGMSQSVLTGPLLDFGQSFWGTDLMHEELPSLESKGFTSTGKYGVGFFSLFMWSDKIQVTTNRYNKGRADTQVLEFFSGTSSRPILRCANESEVIRNGGTKVRIWVEEDFVDELLDSARIDNNQFTFIDLLENLCPSIDCNVTFVEMKKVKSVVKANDWITISPNKLLKRITRDISSRRIKKHKYSINIASQNMETIRNDAGEVVGRAALIPDVGIGAGIVTSVGSKPPSCLV